MQLVHIPLANLSISPANMRAGRKVPDISDILPSVRARGVLVPLLVRQNGSPDTFEIIAGRRRYHAAQVLAAEGASLALLPCAVMEEGDDADAVEASLIENLARLAPDEVTQWETFTRLVKEGRSVEDVAAVFGLTEMMVRRVLALGRLHPRIRKLYADEQIDAATVRQLTLAPLARQRDWLALHRDPDAHAPRGHNLKAWLFGGASISTKVALFDLADYPHAIVTDLFGEESFFSDTDAFWVFQMAAIEARARAYREAGWCHVAVLERGAYFERWEHDRRAKAKGGKVFIEVSARGEVAFHEGWISQKEAQREARGETARADEKPVRPELTSALQSYVALHRHAAVRAALPGHPGVALRLAVAHMIAGSSLWSVRVQSQRAANDAMTESVETCASEVAFDEARRAVLASLGFDPETLTVTGGHDRAGGVTTLFARLLRLDDAAVLAALAVVMGETLEAGSVAVEAVALHIGVDLTPAYTPDDALFDAVRDKAVLLGMLAEIAGDAVAQPNNAATGKTLKTIIRDCLNGSNGRPKVEGWLPRWLASPPRAYTERGGVGPVADHARAAGLLAN